MPWTNIPNPILGMDTSNDALAIDRRSSPLISGCFIRDGIIESDYGMVEFPTAGALKTNALNGTVMKITKFELKNGITYLLAFTTKYLYVYNSVTDTWDVSIRGTLLSDCESAWTASASVTSTADTSVKLRGTYSAKHVIAAAFSATAVGGIDAYTKLMLHCNGVDADTTFTDSSATGRAVTANGDAQLDTAQKKFGTASGLFDGVGDYLSCVDSADWDFDDKDFTIDFWVRFNSLASACGFCGQYADANNFWYFYYGSGNLILYFMSAGVAQASYYGSWTPTTSTWYHIELVRSESSLKIFVDGVSITLTAGVPILNNDVGDVSAVLTIGRIQGPLHTYYLNGWIDEFRLSKGVARHTSNFTPNTVEYDNSASTLVSYINFGAIDISDAINTHLSFWIYSTVSYATETFRIRLSEQNNGGTGATWAEYPIPALVADKWQHVSVPIATPSASSAGTFPTDFNALLSVALCTLSDPGECTIYLDDIRTAQEFTGDEDNRFSFAVLNDIGVITNGIDLPTQVVYSSGVVHQALTLSLPSGSITTCEFVLAMKDHIIYFNNTENGADCPYRASWTNIGSVNDHVNGTAGFQDLTDEPSWIIGAGLLSEGEALIYKENSIILCTWVGGHTPFRFDTIIKDLGLLNKECILSLGGVHHFASSIGCFSFSKSIGLKSLDDKNKRYIYNRLNTQYENRAFIMSIKEEDELQFWIPTSYSYPSEGYCLYFEGDNLIPYRKVRNITAYGVYNLQRALTLADLVGTIGDQTFTFGSTVTRANTPITIVGDADGKIYQLSKGTLNNNGVAIESIYQTPDLISPDTDRFISNQMVVRGVRAELAGGEAILQWSDDGGNTWNPCQGDNSHVLSLTSNFKVYQLNFDNDCYKIRFQVSKNAGSKNFRLKNMSFNWSPRTGR